MGHCEWGGKGGGEGRDGVHFDQGRNHGAKALPEWHGMAENPPPSPPQFWYSNGTEWGNEIRTDAGPHGGPFLGSTATSIPYITHELHGCAQLINRRCKCSLGRWHKT